MVLAPAPQICLTSRMKKKTKTTLMIRLEVEDRAAIKRMGSEMGLTSTSIARLLVNSFVETHQRTHGRTLFPPQLNTCRGTDA